jgi:hypothetical protein
LYKKYTDKSIASTVKGLVARAFSARANSHFFA